MKHAVIVLSALIFGLLGGCESMGSGDKPASAANPAEAKMTAKPAKAAAEPKKKKLPPSGSPFTVYFKADSVEMTENSQGSMFDIMQKIRVYKPKTIHIEAHSDKTGSAESNMRMATKRAEDLQDKLKKAGAKNVTFQAHGESQPLIDLDGPIAANRRAIIIFKEK